MRQKSKEFVLMVPYGAEEAQVSRKMGVDYKEAGKIIKDYLDSFPSLRKYMNRCNYLAKTEGIAKTELGRVRHLPQVKSIYTLYGDQILDSRYAKKNGKTDVRRMYRTLLNAAKNFPIQGLAAHIVNRAMIETMRAFKREGLDAWVSLQVHDEITCIASDAHAQRASEILKQCMEYTTLISIPLVAEPLIADNWADAK
jgi:DNA polymerase-1